MPFILDFINRNNKSLLFLLLLSICLILIFKFQNYHKSVLYGSLFNFESNVAGQYSRVSNYFELQSLNDELVRENNYLKQQNLNLKILQKQDSVTVIDTLHHNQRYELVSAEIVNSLSRNRNNYYTIDKGRNDDMKEGLGVITSKGIVGHIALIDDDYALVLSALHPESKIKSKIKNTEYYGTLVWKGTDSRIMNLQNIDKYVPIQINDTIETYKSTIFPEGILIGTIVDKEIDKKTGKWDISVQLFQDLNSLDYVYVVNNLEKNKIDSIEQRSEILDAE